MSRLPQNTWAPELELATLIYFEGRRRRDDGTSLSDFPIATRKSLQNKLRTVRLKKKVEIGGAARFDRKQDGEEVETQLCRVGLKEQSQGVAVPEQVTINWRRRIGEEQARRRKQVRFSRLDPLRQLHQGPRRCGAAERGATAAQAQAEAILHQWANNAVGERQVQQATTAELRLPKICELYKCLRAR